MQKYMPLLKQNVMKLEVFMLGGQKIDERRDGGEGEERGLRKMNRERRVLERKETKEN